FGEYLKKQPAAAADIEDHPGPRGRPALFQFRDLADGALDESQMVAQYEPAVPLLQAVGGGGLRSVPIVGGGILVQLPRRWLWREPDQAAVGALRYLKQLVRGPVEAIRGTE